MSKDKGIHAVSLMIDSDPKILPEENVIIKDYLEKTKTDSVTKEKALKILKGIKWKYDVKAFFSRTIVFWISLSIFLIAIPLTFIIFIGEPLIWAPFYFLGLFFAALTLCSLMMEYLMNQKICNWSESYKMKSLETKNFMQKLESYEKNNVNVGDFK